MKNDDKQRINAYQKEVFNKTIKNCLHLLVYLKLLKPSLTPGLNLTFKTKLEMWGILTKLITG
jgi:hypothetical protein